MALKKVICKNCENEFMRYIGNQKYCSAGCYSEAQDKKSKNKFIIFHRDGFRCIYCGKSSIEDSEELSIDHILPRTANGKDTADNLVTSCKSCNSTKNNKILRGELMNRIHKEVERRNQENNIHPKTDIKKVE